MKKIDCFQSNKFFSSGPAAAGSANFCGMLPVKWDNPEFPSVTERVNLYPKLYPEAPPEESRGNAGSMLIMEPQQYRFLCATFFFLFRAKTL